MKKLKNVMLKRIMPVFLLIILLFNFIMPNYVYGSLGGVLFEPIKDLICAIADSVLNLLQNTFVTYRSSISTSDDNRTFEIRYSPGIIFKGDIPGLDINFIDPMDPQTAYQYSNKWHTVEECKTTHANQSEAWKAFRTKVFNYLGEDPSNYNPSDTIDRFNSYDGSQKWEELGFSFKAQKDGEWRDYYIHVWRGTRLGFRNTCYLGTFSPNGRCATRSNRWKRSYSI